MVPELDSKAERLSGRRFSSDPRDRRKEIQKRVTEKEAEKRVGGRGRQRRREKA